jgi:hypothetical protein
MRPPTMSLINNLITHETFCYYLPPSSDIVILVGTVSLGRECVMTYQHLLTLLSQCQKMVVSNNKLSLDWQYQQISQCQKMLVSHNTLSPESLLLLTTIFWHSDICWYCQSRERVCYYLPASSDIVILVGTVSQCQKMVVSNNTLLP